jgi:hypothetical protein
MKKCVCVFKDVNTGDTQYQTFYGKNCDVLAANYMSAHLGLRLVSCEIVK